MDPSTVALTAGLTSTSTALIALVVRMIYKGLLVPRNYLQDRIDDRNTIINAKDKVIEEQDKYIATLEQQLGLYSRGSQATLQIVESLPRIAGQPPIRSETS